MFWSYFCVRETLRDMDIICHEFHHVGTLDNSSFLSNYCCIHINIFILIYLIFQCMMLAAFSATKIVVRKACKIQA